MAGKAILHGTDERGKVKGNRMPVPKLGAHPRHKQKVLHRRGETNLLLCVSIKQPSRPNGQILDVIFFIDEMYPNFFPFVLKIREKSCN